MSEHHGIWAYSESEDLMLELLGKGIELASKLHTQLTAVMLGHDVKDQAKELVGYGAQKVIVVDNPQLKEFQVEPYLGALTQLTQQHKPELFLVGSTRRGKELVARLAARLNVGCVPDCLELKVDDQGRLLAERIVYGGNAIVTQVFRIKPQVVTIPRRKFEKPEYKAESQGEVIDESELELEPPKTEIVEVKPIETVETKIEEGTLFIKHLDV